MTARYTSPTEFTQDVVTKKLTGDLRTFSGTVADAQIASSTSVLDKYPPRMHPAEALCKTAVGWWDAAHSTASGQTITNLGWGGSALNAQAGSTAGADSNDPKYLDWDGENYVYLPGVSLNYLSVPDSANLDITGDLDIRVQVALDDWTDAIAPYLIAKNASGQWSWGLQHSSGKGLTFYWTENGSTLKNASSTVAHSTPNGIPVWFRVTLDVDNSASGNNVSFYTSTDGNTWTPLGTTVTQAGVTSVFSGTSIVTLGATASGGQMMTGKILRGVVCNGINGTPVLDIDCSLVSSGSVASFSARTGQTVTINRSTSGRKAAVVTHPLWLLGTDDLLTVADNALLDFTASDNFTIISVVRHFGTFGPGAGVGKTTSWPAAGYALSTAFSVTDGVTAPAAQPPSALPAGGLIVSAGVVDRTAQTNRMWVNGTAGATNSVTAVGSLENAGALTIGALLGVSYSDCEIYTALVFRRALTQAEIQLITDWYTARIGG